MLTIEELKEKISQQVTEVDFLDMLEISTEELVEAFIDKVIENYDKFKDLLE
jgi:anion-transporting  ArsA/GET3 family ATPase